METIQAPSVSHVELACRQLVHVHSRACIPHGPDPPLPASRRTARGKKEEAPADSAIVTTTAAAAADAAAAAAAKSPAAAPS